MKPAKILLCFILSLQFALPAGAMAGDSPGRLETTSLAASNRVDTRVFQLDRRKLDLDKTNGNSQCSGVFRWNDDDWSLSGKTDKNADLFDDNGSQLFAEFGKRTAKSKLVVDPLRPTLFSLHTRDSPRFDQTSAINWDWFTTTEGKITLACHSRGIPCGMVPYARS